MPTRYDQLLDATLETRLRVEFATENREVTDYAVVLLITTARGVMTIRVYDGAHGHNEMHRYTSTTGKQPGTPFHSGTLGEGMRAAIDEIRNNHREMIEGWERQ